MMEYRLDAVERRIDNRRPPTQPEPKPPYVLRRLDPPDRRLRTRYSPIGYRDCAHDAHPRRRGGYAERGHLFDRGDQRIQLGFDRHPIHATRPHRPTCWDPPTQQQDHSYPSFDHRPRRAETCWDRPHHREEVRAPRGHSACHQPHYLSLPPRDMYGQPARVTNQTPYHPSRSPTCWDPSGLHKQQGYPTDDGEEELGDFEDSVLETATKKTKDRDADNSDTESVLNVVIRLPSENHGSREGRDGRPEDQRVSSLDDAEEDDSIEEGPKVIASFPVVQLQSKSIVENYWGKKGDGAYTGSRIIVGIYVDVSVSDITSMKPRLPSLEADARLIPPRNNTPCLSIHECVVELSIVALNLDDHISLPLLIFYGGDKGRHSAVRYAFDAGGDASPSFCFQLSSLVRGSHLEDKVDFNRGGVDTSL